MFWGEVTREYRVGVLGNFASKKSAGENDVADNKEETWGEMFAVVGLTLNDISSGDLPQLRLAGALEARKKQIHYPPGMPTDVAVYTTSATDTQALVARAKYREKGEFLVFLYFNDAAVQICKDAGIPLRIVDRVEDKELPANKEIVLERSYLAPVSV